MGRFNISVKILLPIVIGLFPACANNVITYAEASRIAARQSKELEGRIDEKSAFVKCLLDSHQAIEALCPPRSNINQGLIFRVLGSGRVDRVFYDGDDKHLSCVAENIKNTVCESPPIAPLYIEYRIKVYVD